MKLAARFLFAAAVLSGGHALAQDKVTVVAVPPLSTRATKPTAEVASIAWQATQLIETDLRTTAELVPMKPDPKDFYSYPEVTAPSFPKWRKTGARALITGFVDSRSDGRLTFGCYVYDVETGREVARTGFVVAPSEWRRAAHKCSDLAYTSVTGAKTGMFDTRVAYIAETGAGEARVKRVALMDSDGFDHSYVTAGDTLALTPRLSPDGATLAFVGFTGGQPNVRLVSLGSGEQRPLLPGPATSFAPRFSPDGRTILFTMQVGANADIYAVGAGGGAPRRLTSSPGIDTSASFSPDGRRIVFESDRSGTQQLYVMDADGSGQRRISFGGGRYAAPEWSPDGDRIAFTRRDGTGLRIGVINADGSGEKLLTAGPGDEGASWAPSGRELIFQRTDAGRRSGLYRISVDGGTPRRITTPQAGSDPDWSRPRE